MFSRRPITKAGVPDGVVIYLATPSLGRLQYRLHYNGPGPSLRSSECLFGIRYGPTVSWYTLHI